MVSRKGNHTERTRTMEITAEAIRKMYPGTVATDIENGVRIDAPLVSREERRFLKDNGFKAYVGDNLYYTNQPGHPGKELTSAVDEYLTSLGFEGR